MRAYPHLGGECFESLYLGINIDEEQKTELVEIAKKINSEIIVYQMIPDPNAFRLVDVAV